MTGSKTTPAAPTTDEAEIQIVLEALSGEENVAKMIETSGNQEVRY